MSRKRRGRQSGGKPLSEQRAASPGATEGFVSGKPMLVVGLSFLLAVATLLLYSPVASHPFINYDDGPYITHNPNIQSGLTFETVRWASTSIYAANWHPLTWLLHAFDFQLYGNDASGHHVTSMLFHAVNVVLLFLLLAYATRATGPNFFVAALFAVHPLNVESVAWASELKNVLCTFFFLLALGAYGWYARRPGLWRYLLVFLLFALGLASKPMVITLPFVLLLLDFWPLARIQSLPSPSADFPVPQFSALRLVLEKLPLLALSAASAIITVKGQHAGGAMNPIHVSLGLRIANALVSYVMYLVKTFLPFGLALIYPFPTGGIPLWQPLLSVVVLLVISGIVFRYGLRHGYLILGWLWYLGTLVPVIGLVQVGAQARADRYAYIPLIGIFIMLVWSLTKIADEKNVSITWRAVPALLLLAILSAFTFRQISYWNSDYDLWTRTLAVTENNAIAERELSDYLIRSRRLDEVFPHLRRAVDLDPTDLGARLNLGNAYSSQGRNQEALQEYQAVLTQSLDPKLLLTAALNAGSSYLALGDFSSAEAAYRQALRVSPDNRPALQALDALSRMHSNANAPPTPAK